MKHEILNQILKPQIVWKKYLFLTFSPELLVENKTRKGRTYNIYFISFIKFDWPGQREDRFKVKWNLCQTLYLILKHTIFSGFFSF